MTETMMQPEARMPRFRPGRKWVYGGAAALVVLGAGLWAWHSTTKAGTAISPSNVYHVSYGNVTESISASGTIQAQTQVNLNFSGATGSLLKTLSVKVGDKVKAGQVLATLDDSTAKTQVIQTQATVSQAQSNLVSAQAKLQQAQEGPTPAAVAVAQAAVAKAQASLDGAKKQLADQQAAYNDRTSAWQQVQSAQNAFNQAQLNLQLAQSNAQDSVNAAQLSYNQAVSNENAQAQNLSMVQQEYGNVTSAQVVSAYQAYQTALSTNAANEAALQSTYVSLNSAYTAIQQAQNQYNQAVTAVAQAKVALNNAQTSVQQAQQAFQTAQTNLTAAQMQYNDRTSQQAALDSAQNNVVQAQVGLQSAQASLQQLEQPADPATIQQDQAAVDSAQANVQSAQAQLQNAQNAVANTQLKAPMDGVVTAENGQPGELVSNSQPVVVLEDTNKSDLQLNIQVSQSNIGQVVPDDAVSVSVAAFPNKTYEGKVLQVYPTPQVVSNVTMYTVIASVDNSSGDLKPGMTASVSIVTATHSHVLTVPAISLVQLGSLEGVVVVGTRPTPGADSNNTTGGHTGGSGGYGGGRGSGGGGSGGSGGFGGGGRSGGGSSGSGGFSGGGRASGGAGGQSGGFAGSAAWKNLPQGTYFQPVQVGLFGTRDVEVTRGLAEGESILLVPPGVSGSSGGSQGGGGRGPSIGGIRLGGGGRG